jgi:hypothetical protein
MRKTVLIVLVLCGLASRAAHAQTPVVDVAAIVELVTIINNVRETIRLMREEYQTLQRMARGFTGALDPYRLDSLPPLNHDTAKYEFGRLLLEGLNTGDPRGEKYAAVVRQVLRPGGLFEQLPPEARKVMETAFATIEIADSVATLGVHESALARGYAARIAALVERLKNDVTAGGSEFHEVTAIVDKIALAKLIDARLSQNSNQVESSILEQQLAKNKRLRDAAAAQMNLSMTQMLDNGKSTDAYMSGATTALQHWSLR